jgi:hypothetical protein
MRGFMSKRGIRSVFRVNRTVCVLMVSIWMMWSHSTVSCGTPEHNLSQVVAPGGNYKLLLPAVDANLPAFFNVSITPQTGYVIESISMAAGAGWAGSDGSYSYTYDPASPGMAYNHAKFEGKLKPIDPPKGGGKGRKSSNDFKVETIGEPMKVEVGLEPLPHDIATLAAGRICINAQDKYKKAKWRAIVKPADTTATVTVVSGGVTVTGGTGLSDGATFEVEGTSVGDYELKIVHNTFATCTDTAVNTVFRFVYVHNTDKIVAVQRSSAEVITDTSAGGDHNGGHAKVEWSLAHTDGHYLVSSGIGDAELDAQADVHGWARNYIVGTPGSGENDVEFWAGMAEVGVIQVGTDPHVYVGKARYKTTIELTAKGKTQGYAAMTANIRIGASIFKIIGFGVGTEVNLTGKFACAGGIGLTFRGIPQDSKFHDSWRGYDPYMRGEEHELRTFSHVSDHGTLPINTPFGFSGGVSLRENMGNPWLTGTSRISNMKLTIGAMQYEIIE